jgi:hypothetical protein
VSRFRRRGRDDETPDETVDEATDEETTPAAPSTSGWRSKGPWDVSEVDDPADGRVSLGALWIPGRPGLELRVEADPTTNVVIAVVLVMGTSALQVQPFAAPRSEGIWTDVRTEIKAGITREGGTADEVEGPFGPELRTNLQVKGPDGKSESQRGRFIGVDGPRWFLRGVLTGDAVVSDDAAAELLDVFRDIVVVRGGDAMAPRDAIPLRLPTQVTEEDQADPDGDPLRPFERGPEITEIH